MLKVSTKSFLYEIDIDHVCLGYDGIGEVVSGELELTLVNDEGQCDISDASLFDAGGIGTEPKIILSWGALGQEGIACIFLVEETLKNSVEEGRASVWFGNLCKKTSRQKGATGRRKQGKEKIGKGNGFKRMRWTMQNQYY